MHNEKLRMLNTERYDGNYKEFLKKSENDCVKVGLLIS